MKHYTIGQIHKLKLLVGFDGKPYKNKATVSRVVNRMKWKKHLTRWGYAKVVSEKEIALRNKNVKEYGWGWLTIEALRSIPNDKRIMPKTQSS